MLRLTGAFSSEVELVVSQEEDATEAELKVFSAIIFVKLLIRLEK